MQVRMIHFFFLTAPLAALLCLPRVAHTEEWETSSPYYEDDAWYDVSEWLDGNDYNPTDEVLGRWDDESYDWSAVSSDNDNDAYSGYGYDKKDANDNWYYDYNDSSRYTDYGTADKSGLYSRTVAYYDLDNDGAYDTFSSIQDSDADGTYDRFTYYSFGDNSGKDSSSNKDGNSTKAGDKQSKSQSQKMAAKKQQIRGTVENTKKMKVRNGAERLIAQVASDEGKTVVVDLGSFDEMSQQQQGDRKEQSSKESNAPIKQGTRIVATGPMIKVGDKQAVLAQTFQIGDGKEQQANRSRRTLDGKITKLKTAKVRGQEHQLALVQLDSDKKVLVDLGDSKDLQANLSEGDEIKVSGVPAKVRNQHALIAVSVTKDGKRTKIDRMALSDSKQSGS